MDRVNGVMDLNSDDTESTLSSACSFLETPPSSPPYPDGTDLSSLGSFDAFEPSQEPKIIVDRTDTGDLSNIQRRKTYFFSSIKDLVLPLLSNPGFFDNLEDEGPEGASFQVSLRSITQPKGLRAVLKPYQVEGLSWLLQLRDNGIGGILGDDMGLGKTLQTLALFQQIKENDNWRGHKFLVVCPLSVVDTWMSEISKWTTGLSAVTYHGTVEQRESAKKAIKRHEKTESAIVVTSYETVLQNISWFRRAYIWDYVVLDEGHRIKNSRSKRAQGLEKIRSEYKLVLTGTPIQNDLTELWSILHWLYPEVFVPGTIDRFEAAFSLSEGIFDCILLQSVKQFLKLVMLRRTKDCPEIGLNVLPKTETILTVPITEMQNSWYWRILTGADQNSEGTVSTPEGNPNLQFEKPTPAHKTGFIDLTMDTPIWESCQDTNGLKRSRITTNTLMELRKCSIHPYILEDAFPSPYELGQHLVTNSGKFIVLQKMIRQFVIAERKKILIFSTFDRALTLCEDLLAMELGSIGFGYVRLDGGTSSAWRTLRIHLFNNDPRYMVFLLSIRAGGEGLNLVTASTVIFLDEDWNPQVMRQAESRVHRLGQTEPVSIFRLQSKGTVEEQMCRRLSKKAYLATKVLDDIRCPSAPSSPINTRFAQDVAISLIPTSGFREDITMLKDYRHPPSRQ